MKQVFREVIKGLKVNLSVEVDEVETSGSAEVARMGSGGPSLLGQMLQGIDKAIAGLPAPNAPARPHVAQEAPAPQPTEAKEETGLASKKRPSGAAKRRAAKTRAQSNGETK